MDLKVLRLVFLLAAVLMLAGCASAEDTAADPANDLVPVPSHDDSHGWGANLKGM
jgi:uncharacterized lipoprotein YajG